MNGLQLTACPNASGRLNQQHASSSLLLPVRVTRQLQLAARQQVLLAPHPHQRLCHRLAALHQIVQVAQLRQLLTRALRGAEPAPHCASTPTLTTSAR